jgi:hypothetical protein
MKKMIYLMLLFMVLGAASMNAQVRIGGTADPDKSAVLDLNSNDGTANGGLALPRVELTSTTQQLNGAEPKPGTVVYNTTTALEGEGTYVWTKVGSGSGTDFTGISVEEGTGTTVTGTGTTESPLKVDIATNGVTTGMIQDGQVTAAKLNAMNATSGQVLKRIGSAWTPATDDAGVTSVSGSRGLVATKNSAAYDVALPSATSVGSLLRWDGNAWVPGKIVQRVFDVETETREWTPYVNVDFYDERFDDALDCKIWHGSIISTFFWSERRRVRAISIRALSTPVLGAMCYYIE